MVAGVAHDLDNPLAVVIGSAELLRQERIDARVAERLARVDGQAERALEVVRSLLTPARRSPPDRTRGDVNDLASDPADGTHAVVALPAARERESEPVTSPGEEPAETPRIRVLVVDDEALVADLVSEILRLDGHHVDHATNGLDALARIRAGRYGLVVSDVHMPDLDGPTFYRQLLDIDPAYADRIVFITGDVLSVDTQRFLRTSGVPYLEKPFGITTFQAVVRRVLRPT
jgi:CheY-like chemotaxis protein